MIVIMEILHLYDHISIGFFKLWTRNNSVQKLCHLCDMLMKSQALMAFGNQCEAGYIEVVADQLSRDITFTMMEIET